MLGLGLLLLVQAHGIAGFEALSSPGALPLAAASVLVLAAGFTVLRPRSATADATPLLPPTLLVLGGLIGLFALVLEPLGFLLAGTGFLTTAFLVLDRRRPLRALGLAATATLGAWVLFRLVFEVLLPEGIVPERAILAWIEDALAALWSTP